MKNDKFKEIETAKENKLSIMKQNENNQNKIKIN